MRAKKNLLASYLFIILNILINLLVVRLTVHYYGDKLYSFLVIAFSFVTYVESLNMGVYLSNRTQIPMRGEKAQVLTISSFRYLTKLSLSLLIIFVFAYYHFSDKLINFITIERDVNLLQVGKTLIFISVIYSLLKIPLSLVLSAFAGHDLIDVEKKYNGLQQLAKFAALIFAICFDFSVVTYFFIFSFLSILILVIANIHYYLKFISRHKKLLFRYSKKIKASYITLKSFKFFVFTMATVVVWSTDNLLVSIFFTPEMVTNYQINFSIFNAAFLFITAIAGAMISNYGNLIRDRDYEGLNFRLNFSIYTAFLCGLMIAFGGILFAEEIITLWVGEHYFVSKVLVLAFGLFGLTLAFSSVLNTVLALFASSKIIMGMAISEAVLNILLSVVFSKLLGVEGIALGTSIAALLAVVIPGLYILTKYFKGIVLVDYSSLSVQLLFSGTLSISFLFMEGFDLWKKIVVFVLYVVGIVALTYILKKQYFLNLVRPVFFRFLEK